MSTLSTLEQRNYITFKESSSRIFLAYTVGRGISMMFGLCGNKFNKSAVILGDPPDVEYNKQPGVSHSMPLFKVNLPIRACADGFIKHSLRYC